MKKILLIALLFWTKFVQSQTSRIVYTNVLHGDTLFQVKITETGVPDSVIRFNYVKRDVIDSLLVNGVMTYTYTQVTDTIPYTYNYFRVTNTVRDSVQMNKLAIQPPLQAGANIKTINSESPLGSGNINVSGGAAAWADITGKPATFPPDAHNHDATYSAISHNHLGVYQPIGSYLVAADIVGKQNNITLTTTGTSGAATFVGSTLNIPNYATGGGMTRVFLPSDVINNNAVANTIVDVTGLSFAVTANTTYKFRFVIVYSAAATTTGSRWSINGPAATHMSYISQYTLTATSITNNAALAGYNLPAASNASSLTTNNRCIIEGEIRPSANGTVIARFASEVASSAITAVASGRSYVEYQIIN